MDEKKHIFLGKPLAEAAKAEPLCNHLKYDSDPLLSNFVLDWFAYWNRNEDVDVEEIIESMNTEKAFDNYYKNTLLYVMAAKQRYAIWNEYMICQDINKLKSLCEMGENADGHEKILRCQGIALLTSDKVTRNVEYILNRKEAIWFDEKNKDILLMFNNGFIEINGIKVSFDQLKSLYT